nr:arf GAP with coiled coil ANK repeat and PH [Hymenolepis microstoma]
MSSDCITIPVNGKDLWSSLNYNESLRCSPKFRLALRISEYEVETLQSRYKEAVGMFVRTNKAGEIFADALNGLCRCLNNLVTPSPTLPIDIDREAEIQRIIRSIYSFSNLVNDFSSRILQSTTLLTKAGAKLDELSFTRKEFYRASENVEAAVNKAAGVSRSRLSDAEEADGSLIEARTNYAHISEVYLSQLRTVICPIRLSTVLRATINTFETQQNFSNAAVALNQSEDCIAALKKSITMYDTEAANQSKPVSNGVYPSPSAEKAIRYEGFLFKRSKKKRWRTWVRRWFMVTDNRLVYFSSLSDTFTSLTWKILEPDLRLCTAKAVQTNFGSGDPLMMSSSIASITDRRFVFELISPTGKVHYLQAESAEALEKWVSVLRSGIINSTSTNGELKLSTAMMCSSLSGSRDSLRSLSGVLLLDEPPSAGNRLCADCLTSQEVKWASTNLGVTLCTDCAACHRSLGVHISKVRSLTLDNWEPELLEVMRNLGNNLVASVYESNLAVLSNPSDSQSPLPRRPHVGELNTQLRRAWIEAKWVKRVFVRSFVHPSVTVWLLELYRTWLLQAHSRRISRVHNSPNCVSKGAQLFPPPSTPSTPGSKITRSHRPRLVDRRRFSTVVRGSTARAQVTLDTLCAHLDSLVFSDSARPTPSAPPTSVREKAASRLVLVAGARLGCAPLILAGLARGASPNAYREAAEWARLYRLPQPSDGDPLGALTPPLISAVTGGRIAACELLLTNGADINAVDQDGRTALHHACSLQRVHLVCLLLRRLANHEIKDKDGRRPIDVAIDTAHADIVTLLRLQPLHSDSRIIEPSTTGSGKDDTAVEVFRDFTTRAYHLEWDSEEEDYHESSNQSTSRDRQYQNDEVVLDESIEKKKPINEETQPLQKSQSKRYESPIGSSLKIAVLMLACNRIAMNRSLSHLVEYRSKFPNGRIRFPIYVSQDCNDENVLNLLHSYGNQITVLNQPDHSETKFAHVKKNLKGYYKISRNYNWSLGQMFDVLQYNLTLVVEDDLDISPDFFDYFFALGPLLLEDKTLFCISAWNDNGKPSLIDLSRNDLLYRSDFFPGLGWMLTRRLWDENLRSTWPDAYWDEYMRTKAIRNGRACIRPEISRSHTFGRFGVSNGQFFDTHLQFNHLSDKPHAFNSTLLRMTLRPEVYDPNFLSEVYDKSVLLTSLDQLAKLKEIAPKEGTSCRYEYSTQNDFITAAKYVGAMHDFKEGVARTAYRGVVPLFYNGRRIYFAPKGSRGFKNNAYPDWK